MPVKLDHSHHLLYHSVSCGAIRDVLMMHMHILFHLLAGQVRKAGTIQRADLIDTTHIGLEIKELTGLLYIQIVANIIFIRIFFLELISCHIKMSRDPPDVFRSVGRAHCFAAIRAAEAICFVPYLFVYLDRPFIESFWWLLTQTREKQFQLPLVKGNFFSERPQIDWLHALE
jgi:hypothetical protein